jgi:hypothetical protein
VSPDPTTELWSRLARPVDPAGAIEALAGVAPGRARQLVDLGLVTSPEVDRLLDRMHETLRSLAIATTASPVRSVGEIRGPVLWSETVAARSASPGAGDVFICASPVKAYDTDENRVLVHALVRIRSAARTADPTAQAAGPDEVLRRARYNGTRAIRALEHRTLASVSRAKPDGRAMRKARTGSKARSYRTAVAVLERAGEPVDVAQVVEHCDEHTRAQHHALLTLLDRLAPDAPLHLDAGMLRAGPVHYLHRHRPETNGLSGILLGNLLVDVPDDLDADPVQAEADLLARSHGHPSLVLHSPTDIERALRLANV